MYDQDGLNPTPQEGYMNRFTRLVALPFAALATVFIILAYTLAPPAPAQESLVCGTGVYRLVVITTVDATAATPNPSIAHFTFWNVPATNLATWDRTKIATDAGGTRVPYTAILSIEPRCA